MSVIEIGCLLYLILCKNKTPRPGSLVFGKRGGFCCLQRYDFFCETYKLFSNFFCFGSQLLMILDKNGGNSHARTLIIYSDYEIKNNDYELYEICRRPTRHAVIIQIRTKIKRFIRFRLGRDWI